jgi:hypothetical protein
MADITRTFTHDGTAEDVWFSDRIAETTNYLPSTDIAMRFALVSNGAASTRMAVTVH